MAPPRGRRYYEYLVPDGHPIPISDELIAFVSKDVSSNEPSRKRQKMTVEKIDDRAPEDSHPKVVALDYVVVKEASWEIECPGSRLSNFVAHRHNIKPLVVCLGSNKVQDKAIPRHVEILDDGGEVLKSLLLPENKESIPGIQDVYIALQVYKNGSDSAQDQGKVFVEFGISLFQRNGSDYLGK